MNNLYLLKMSGIDKRFPGTHALKNVNFDLKQGEVHALIGQNGSGKSTLMNILSGSIHKDKGVIERKGRAINISSPMVALENGITMIHQELKLFPALTVAENIFFGNYPKKNGLIDWSKLWIMAEEAVLLLSNEIDIKQKVMELSTAQQQIVEIVRALVKKTEVVIMDEPTASLTGDEVKELFDIIRRIKGTGVSFIFISHRLDEVLEIADRVTVLRDGELIATIDRENIYGKEMLVELMINIKLKDNMHKRPLTIQELPIILETKDLCFNNKLHNVSLTLRKGEILGIAGLLGSGRTELLKVIFGALKADTGQVLINGRVLKKRTPENAVKAGIAFVSEDRKVEGLFLHMSISDNIIYSSFHEHSSSGFINNKKKYRSVTELASRLYIKSSNYEDYANSLSGGNQQKVVLAKWLAANSTIILMDEPTRGIDIGSKSEIYNLVRQLAQSGKSILFVSSELEEIELLCDRILVMRRGSINKELPGGSTVEEMMLYAV